VCLAAHCLLALWITYSTEHLRLRQIKTKKGAVLGHCVCWISKRIEPGFEDQKAWSYAEKKGMGFLLQLFIGFYQGFLPSSAELFIVFAMLGSLL